MLGRSVCMSFYAIWLALLNSSYGVDRQWQLWQNLNSLIEDNTRPLDSEKSRAIGYTAVFESIGLTEPSGPLTHITPHHVMLKSYRS